MERTLHQRFGRAAATFGRGLKSALRGSLLGIGVALLNRLINPIKEIEDRIKEILGQSQDLTEEAARFNTSTGQIQRIKSVAGSLGVKPEALKDLMGKFATAIEGARLETDPTAVKSADYRVLQNYLGEKDLGKSFIQFLSDLKDTGNGAGQDIYFSDREQRRALERERNGTTLGEEERRRLMAQGLIQHRSGAETRSAAEQIVFGNSLTGSAADLVNTDVAAQATRLRLPSEALLSEKIAKTHGLARQYDRAKAFEETRNIIGEADALTSKTIGLISGSEADKSQKEIQKLNSTDFLNRKSAQQGLDKIIASLDVLTEAAAAVVGWIGNAPDKYKGVLPKYTPEWKTDHAE